MSKVDKRKLWACFVALCLAVIAVAAVDVALMLHDGIEVEYVEPFK